MAAERALIKTKLDEEEARLRRLGVEHEEAKARLVALRSELASLDEGPVHHPDCRLCDLPKVKCGDCAKQAFRSMRPGALARNRDRSWLAFPKIVNEVRQLADPFPVPDLEISE